MIYDIELAVTWATISKDGRQGKLFWEKIKDLTDNQNSK
jgi:hypothetical protein